MRKVEGANHEQFSGLKRGLPTTKPNKNLDHMDDTQRVWGLVICECEWSILSECEGFLVRVSWRCKAVCNILVDVESIKKNQLARLGANFRCCCRAPMVMDRIPPPMVVAWGRGVQSCWV